MCGRLSGDSLRKIRSDVDLREAAENLIAEKAGGAWCVGDAEAFKACGEP
jgi:hypothetical protein